MDVEDAEGRDGGEVGEDNTLGNEQWRMLSNDIRERDGCETQNDDTDLYTLHTWAMQSAHECAHTRKSVRMCE